MKSKKPKGYSVFDSVKEKAINDLRNILEGDYEVNENLSKEENVSVEEYVKEIWKLDKVTVDM